MAKRYRKVSTKRSKRPRRSKSSSRKTMKRTKRTKQQSSRKHTSKKPKKVIRKSVRKRKRTINDIKKGGGKREKNIEEFSNTLKKYSIDISYWLIMSKHLIKLNYHCNDDTVEEAAKANALASGVTREQTEELAATAAEKVKSPLRDKYFLYPIQMEYYKHYPELSYKKCIPAIYKSIQCSADTFYGLFYIKPNKKDPATFFENKVICISKKYKYIKLISPDRTNPDGPPDVRDLDTSKQLLLEEIVEKSKLIKDETVEKTELETLMEAYQLDIITPGQDTHPIDQFLRP